MYLRVLVFEKFGEDFVLAEDVALNDLDVGFWFF